MSHAVEKIRSSIDSGNDLLDGDDLFKALHYGYGVKDSKVALIQVDATNSYYWR